MKRIALVFVLLITFGMAGNAVAETHTSEEAGVSFWSPDDWKAEVDGDGVTMTNSDDIFLSVMVLEADEVEIFLDELGKQLEDMVTDVEMSGEPEESEINGMPAIMMEATGKAEGTTVEIGLIVVMTPSGKAMIVFGLGTPEALEKNGDDIGKVMTSIKPL